MLKYIYTVLNTSNKDTYVLQNLAIIALFALIFHIYKMKNQAEFGENVEGFDQVEPFVLKRDQDVYDETYSTMYDTLSKTVTRSNWEIENILKMTDADKRNSVFLDVGSCSGYKVNRLQELGYVAYGVDKSKDMIDRSHRLFSEIVVKEGDVMEPMLFERDTFTHIMCLNFTIYEFENKTQFFSNCYYWMLPNSYLLLHLVEPRDFKPTMTSGKNTAKGRVTDTLVEFYDFNYNSQYKFSNEKTDNNVIFTQTITDKKTKNIRQYEQTLYMDDITDIIKLANKSGFIFHGKMSMSGFNKDEHQYLYVLERAL